ncbi:flagellar biosynthesis protein FlhB [Sphingomonas sp. TREG-RG-20F-R18-01]|uniref:flagellar biosynthesis protein FlhB n=1 Tax=Sphingomonas sp. TREG-RG-20F-R18-01 TaxID=2914982 RepID=UPI001F59BE2B
MAGDKDQKTHGPTDKRLDDARAKGDVAQSPEVRHAFGFVGMLIATGSVGTIAFARLGTALARLWGNAEAVPLGPVGTHALIRSLCGVIGATLLPLFASLIGCALLGGVLQARPMVIWSRIAPRWSKLSPIAGAKRLFGMRALVEFAKTLAKLIGVGTIAGLALRPFVGGFETLVGLAPIAIGTVAGGVVAQLVRSVAILVGAIALFDFVYQRRTWLAKMRMSLQEIKDEHKQQEGDPKIKAKIRQIGMQRARRRMMAAVPDASVVITNPTHFAVALKYDHNRGSAPIVVAKGTDAIALKIREVATAAGVPLVENRPLARALYASAEIDRPIPVEHYAAVAEVIGYVLRLARARR